MKLNLECGTDIRNGYVNVSMFPPKVEKLPEDVRFVVGDFNNLSPLVENNTIEEIVFCPPLNCIVPSNLDKVISHWKLKLIKSGKLSVNFYDIFNIASAIVSGRASLQDAHTMLYGPQHNYRCIIDTISFKAMVKNIGLNIETISISGPIVTAELTNA